MHSREEYSQNGSRPLFFFPRCKMTICQQLSVGDCDSRVIWIVEDELGNVAAVGALLCILPVDSQAWKTGHCCHIPVPALVSSELITVHRDSRGTVFNLPREREAISPVPTDVYDSVYVQEHRRLYVLGADALLAVEEPTAQVRVLAEGLQTHEDEPRYAGLRTDGDLIVAYRYGLSLWKSTGERVLADDQPYSHAALSPTQQIMALDDCRVIHEIDIDRGIVSRMKAPEECAYFFGFVGGKLVVVWGRAEDGIVWIIRDGQVRTLCLVSAAAYGMEAYCQIPELDALAIGTAGGELIIVDVKQEETIERIAIEGEERVVELHWSARSKRLFVGTRHGAVYVFSVSK